MLLFLPTLRHANFLRGMKLPPLPVLDALPEVIRRLASDGVAVLSAPPGSGKTTLSPLLLMDAPWLDGRRIVMLEPRRVAARLAATRMAALLGEHVGERVGYRIRFERRVSDSTRIEVMTEGTLIRQLQRDPELTGIGLVIFDEVHERNLDTDLALTLTTDVRDSLRPDLRILAMSATADSARFARFLRPDEPAPVITAEGDTHPLTIRYTEPAGASLKPDLERIARTVRDAVRDHDGDALVFLPGAREIERTAKALHGLGVTAHHLVCPLHGGLPSSVQDKALRPDHHQRRIVLATNIAESSVTIEGIRIVVDAGFERFPQFDAVSGLTRLATRKISASSAEQRAGRAARLGPGVAYRVWSEYEHPRLERDILPEILEADLAPLALELFCWGCRGPEELRWLDAPPAGPFAQALDLLKRLGALDASGRLTQIGRRLADLPAHPRIARMLSAAADTGSDATIDRACDLAVLTEGRDPTGERTVDIEEGLAALRSSRRQRSGPGVDLGVSRALDAQSKELKRRCRRLLDLQSQGESRVETDGCKLSEHLTVGGLLSLGFPDRIAARRPGPDARYLLENGRGVRVDPQERIAGAPFLVALRVGGSVNEGLVTRAAELEESSLKFLHAGSFRREEQVGWNPRAGAVKALERTRLGAIVLSERSLTRVAPESVAAALLDGIRQVGVGALHWDDAARAMRARVATLRRFCPEAGWPDLSDEALTESLDDWLGPWLGSATRIEQLRAIDLAGLMSTLLGWQHMSQLDDDAPTHLSVPSGRRARLVYGEDGPPVLAVRLQELFGMLETPAIAGGRIPVMVHLLSPAGRPVQVTQDLAGFWARTYADVRKELKGRYPKHYWPEDPYSATATERVRPPQPRD